MGWAKALAGLARVLVSDLIPWLTVLFRSPTSLLAENLFLREQLAFYQEHKLKPQPLTDAAPLDSGVVLSSVRVEKRSGDGQAGHPDRLASQRFQMVLAL